MPLCSLSDIIKSYNIISITYHPYADDSQVYVAFKTNDATSIKNRIESCVGDICRWMNRNDLKLNEHKTEVVLLSSKFRDGLHWITWTLEMKGFPYLIRPQALE